ncbi:hypothetical protein E4S40_10990 [Algoriphagus kandeliae]|uniref:Outer membrane protein beta-barrel domain-containing protein n=1 Tax=Algoriphagus kandeliae TaxID=2562278 RepID=A0A4Y9QQQ1_9BACT|nr:hypothetical protein [Algoriphagus kandeliae]TFV94537.1 hypothetical protein E4S40_10990 [Algoriphagus kandeliae]
MRKVLFSICICFFSNLLFAQEKDHAVYTESNLSSFEKKKLRQERSGQDGNYLLFQGGLRRHLTTEGNNLYLPISGEMDGIVQGNLGYRIGNISMETGLGFIWHNSELEYQLGQSEKSIITKSNHNSIFLPLGFRYSIPLNNQQRLRIGAHAISNLILFSSDRPDPNRRFPYYGSGSIEGVSIDFTVNEPKFKSFFKIGIHAEILAFKSSFLSIQASHVLSVPSTLRTITYQWEDGIQSGEFETQTSLNGWIVEFGYKLPLNILSLKD